MKLYDAKDVNIVAQTIHNIAPIAVQQRAELIVYAAWVAGVDFHELKSAAERVAREGITWGKGTQ